MQVALQLAKKAMEQEEVPIGAVVMHGFKILGKGFNQVEQLKDATAHAEILALSAAMQTLNAKYLEECMLIVTVEPCLMCYGAAMHARIKTIFYAVEQPKFGVSRYLEHFPVEMIKIPSLENEARTLLQRFFEAKR